MRARDSAQAMLAWLEAAGAGRVDVAARRAAGGMAWLRGARPEPGWQAWARAENVRGADIYVRPARGGTWPLVFLDDVEPGLAGRIAAKYRALAVRTSAAGGCHVWLACARGLTEAERGAAQRWLARRTGADPGSVSGEHLGRLAGFKNWKRGGEWVNVSALSIERPAWEPRLCAEEGTGLERSRPRPPAAKGVDASESAREWGWVCGALEAGAPADLVRERLAARALPRRGADAPRYAKRTVEKAVRHVEKGR